MQKVKTHTHLDVGTSEPSSMECSSLVPAESLTKGSGKPPPPPPKNWLLRNVNNLLHVLNGAGFQTVTYFVFILIFQLLAKSMRVKEEYYLDKHVMDRFVENHFDSSHNTFDSVRRVADIYEWGNNVLWPGSFGDMGPCREGVGPQDALNVKTCVDEVWPDGEGPFHLTGATAYTVNELVEQYDKLDWTEGITIRQARVAPQACVGTHQLGACLPDLTGNKRSDRTPFGYNWSQPDHPPRHSWRYWAPEDLGTDPAGFMSAAIPSMRTIETGGFVAVIIPFFSDSWLNATEGTYLEVPDFRDHYVTPTNERTPRFYCVRVSYNAEHIKQLCDPTTRPDAPLAGRMTGVVRATVEELWNDLKRGHFIDMRTRSLAITLQLRSNNVGIRYRLSLLFELTSLGAVFPSYDVETRVAVDGSSSDMSRYANFALMLVALFAFLEMLELSREGAIKYFQDLWNVMDWVNYLLVLYFYWHVRSVMRYEAMDCDSLLCQQVGYYDDWQLMKYTRDTKVEKPPLPDTAARP